MSTLCFIYEHQAKWEKQWSQDAARMGSLIKGDWKIETELRQTLINNLTWLHLEHAKAFDSNMTFDKLHQEIDDSYIQHHVSHIRR
jgi:hypothetical protein